jgi:import inner membrane translocase subunit TIM50
LHASFCSCCPAADPGAYKFQPENTLKLKPWKGDPQDTTLLDLIPFLLMINQAGVSDVRRVVASYDGEEDAVAAFKKRMQEVAAHKKLRLPGGGLFRR